MADESPLKRGKALIAAGKLLEAVELLGASFVAPESPSRVWVGFQLANALRKLGRIEDALTVLRKSAAMIGSDATEPEWTERQRRAIFGLASWCIWDRDVKEVEDPGVLLHAANTIYNTMTKGGLDLFEEPSPFIMASLKSAKIGLRAGRSEEAVAVLQRIPSASLSAERIALKNGEEMSSDRERWFEMLSKGLVLTEHWKSAIELCDQALQSELHHQVSYTIGYRRAQALAGAGRVREAVAQLGALLRRRREWWVQAELARHHWMMGNQTVAIGLAVAAAIDAGIDEKSARHLVALAGWLREFGQPQLGVLIAPIVRQIWSEHGWKLKGELSEQVESLASRGGAEAVPDRDIAKTVRQLLWETLDQFDPPKRGVVTRILPDGRAAFIRVEGQVRDVYARMPKRPLTVGSEVTLRLVESYDFKRQEDSVAAMHVRPVHGIGHERS